MSLPPFQASLDAHGADVHRFLVFLVGRQEADDCFQDTFLAALRAYPRLRPDSNVRSWLFAVARSKAVDRQRSERRQPLAVEALPDAMAETRSDPPEVWRHVHALPEKQRLAVAYRYACDLPYREIAALLSVSEPAARQNVSEGLRQLRKVVPRD